MRALFRAASPALLAALLGCSSSSGGTATKTGPTTLYPGISTAGALCPATTPCIAIMPAASETNIAAVLGSARAGTTIVFEEGTYQFDNELDLGTASNITILGAGMGKTILDFIGQQAGENGIFGQTVSHIAMEGFTVLDTPGNGIKMLDVTGLTFKSLEVTWTLLDKNDGAYGLYPVQSSDVLIDGCSVSGGSDSGIYVGQSQNIVVRNNTVFQNVGGIEIENSFSADVYGNTTHDNTAGVLVFDLPNLQQEGGHDIRVYSNTIANNNTANFAASGDIVSQVPVGTGFFVMANHDVEVFDNTITGNNTIAIGINSYAILQMTVTDPSYYEWPSHVYVHDNTCTGNGTAPGIAGPLNLLFTTAVESFPGMHVPDVVYDGIVDPTLAAMNQGPNPMTICGQDPTAGQVCNMHFDQLNSSMTNLSMIYDCSPATGMACTLPALPAVSFPGLTP